MDDQLNLSMFRAYDIRTPAERLTPELAERLARAEAAYFRNELDVPGVVLAHDARRSGPDYLLTTAQTLRRSGLDVVFVPWPCTASFFYYTCMRYRQCAGILIGASHNPAGDTGHKIVGPGVTPIAEGIGPAGGLNRIREYYVADVRPASDRRGRFRAVDRMADYVAYSRRLAGFDRALPTATDGSPGAGRSVEPVILQDFLYGAAGREMLLGFSECGLSVEPLHFVPDGRFPLGAPNPVKPDVVRAGLERLRSGRFLFGLFFDGDGDRMDVYRGDGTYLASSFVYAAVLPEIVERFRRRAASDPRSVRNSVFAGLKCNPVAVREMARAGVSVDVIRNGHSQIKKSLADDPTKIGAVEESGHFYEAFAFEVDGRAEEALQWFYTENTLYFALLVARVWLSQPERFERMFELQATTAREREWGYKFPSDQARAEALQAVRERFEQLGFVTLDRMKSGMDLDATLMRRGVPLQIEGDVEFDRDWLQVCQRVSHSEDRLARWEVVGASAELVQQAKAEIERCVGAFGAGSEYRG